MWDRLRSATGGGDNYSPFSAASQPSSAPTASWQPRSSVIAARRGGGQQRHASLEGGAYHLAGSAGPPPPRPPRELKPSIVARQSMADRRRPSSDGERLSLEALADSRRAPTDSDIPIDQPRSQNDQFRPPPRSQTLPVPTTPTAQHHAQRDSLGRPPSSIYSQPSPLHTDFPSRRQPQNNASGYSRRRTNSLDDVSPPSSPEMDRAGFLPAHDISPIDEEDDPPAALPRVPRPLPTPYDSTSPDRVLQPAPDMRATTTLPSQRDREHDGEREASSSPQSGQRSNIPMMRRERRAQRDAEAAASRVRSQDGSRAPPPPRTTSREGDRPRGQRNPRWDPMTGEVTMSDKGRPSQVKPVEYARGLGISTMASYTPGPAERIAARQARPGGGPQRSATDPAAVAFAASTRPSWRGASGRTAIVDPVQDNTEVAPLKIPPKSSRRASSRPGSTEPVSSNGGGGGGGGGGGNGGGSEGVGGAATGLVSPPISPETLTGEQPNQTVQGQQQPQQQQYQQYQQRQQMGGGGSAGKAQGPNAVPTAAAAAKASLANTFRRMMPSSSSTPNNPSSGGSAQGRKQTWLFGRDDSAASTAPGAGVHGYGYPSPPLSGSPTVSSPGAGPAGLGALGLGLGLGAAGAGAGAGGVAAEVPGGRSAASPAPDTPGSSAGTPVQTPFFSTPADPRDANAANIANVHAPALAPARHPPARLESPQPPADPLVTPTRDHQHNVFHGTLRLPSASGSIRRKEIGSSVSLSADSQPTPTSTSQRSHRPHDSFSSSVYSRPDDDDDNLPRAALPDWSQPQPQGPRPLPPSTRLNTKNLPSLPPGANDDTRSPYVQPPSRFSVTTYATSAHTSPRPSLDADAPPLPTAPKEFDLGAHSSNTKHRKDDHHDDASPPSGNGTMNALDASVLERKRPEMRGGKNKWDEPEGQEEPVKISLSKAWMTTAGANSAGINAQPSPPRTRRDPHKGLHELPRKSENKENEKSAGGRGFGFGFLGPRSPATGSDSNSNSSRPASIMSNMDKDLPPPPSQAPASATSTGDRINQLNSQLQDLANRRLNINRAIRQMTELMPQDNLMLPDEVRRKREVEKRKIEELNAKLADIGREEHDLGMKLHRAYKKLDQQTEYEPTTLWVRRATGS